MKTRTIYVAFDDKTFDSAEACRAYEAQHVEIRLVGLTIDQVRAALSREDAELADAIEELGNRIARARREAGDLKRGRKVSAPVEAATHETAPPADDARASLMDEALSRARSAGRATWDAGKGAIVPDAFAGAKPLHEAWLEGWREGQAEAEERHGLREVA